MSIDAILQRALGKQLFRLLPEPLFADEDPVEPSREMYVSADVHVAVMGPFPDTLEGRRRGEFWGWMEAWMYGAEISVSEYPHDKLPETQLARVSPVEAEFWSIRVPPPLDKEGKPIADGLRSLGAFHAHDEFVALTWEYRDIIDREFGIYVEAAQQAWIGIFDSVPPHKGDNLHAYLSRFMAYTPAG